MGSSYLGLLFGASLIAVAHFAPANASEHRMAPEDRPLTKIDPATHPCDAYDGSAELITFDLDLRLEGRTVRFRVPEVYLEDLYVRVEDTRRKSMIFTVDIRDFTPVSRRESSERNKRDVWNWMTFLVSDLISLEEIAAIKVYLNRALPERPLSVEGLEAITEYSETNRLPIDKFAQSPGPFGLSEVAFGRKARGKQVFLYYWADGSLSDVLECGVPGVANSPGCIQYFEIDNISVKMSYKLTELQNWRQNSDRVKAFIKCALAES